ncbi:hypothetical protein [Nonomuraea typhae]|uniref:Uncharacterized protein n=1 Tax=Nonomuraea typhae TaxID=2603600 RepID=A0ABW7Z1J3_9ACTN
MAAVIVQIRPEPVRQPYTTTTEPTPTFTTVGPVKPQPLRPVRGVADLAANAAVLAAAESAADPAPTAWAYVKSDHGELWRRLDDQKFAIVEDGKVKVIEGSEFEVGYRYLLSLPTDPDRLLERIYATIDDEHARARDTSRAPWKPLTAGQRDSWAFQQIAQGMRDAVLPAKLRAVMYGALAKIPGTRYQGKAVDPAGRAALSVYLTYGAGLRDEIFVHPRTYAYLGYRTDEKGRTIGSDAVLKAVIVAGPGRRS